nr:MAG TPA: hypothetical protein [Caudoviricetes sp.]
MFERNCDKLTDKYIYYVYITVRVTDKSVRVRRCAKLTHNNAVPDY